MYIPKDVHDCFAQIDLMLNDSTKMLVKTWTEKDFLDSCDAGFRHTLASRWQFYTGSRLLEYFHKQGIEKYRDMTTIILRSYHRYQTNKEIELENQFKERREEWQEEKKKQKFSIPGSSER